MIITFWSKIKINKNSLVVNCLVERLLFFECIVVDLKHRALPFKVYSILDLVNWFEIFSLAVFLLKAAGTNVLVS